MKQKLITRNCSDRFELFEEAVNEEMSRGWKVVPRTLTIEPYTAYDRQWFACSVVLEKED